MNQDKLMYILGIMFGFSMGVVLTFAWFKLV